MVNRDDLIAYLLHEIPEGDRLEFAERWFVDPDLSEQLSGAEAELFDAYVRDELPRKQRDRVEQYLLNSDEQRRKLDFAAALRGAFPQSRKQRIPWLAAVAAAAILILIGATLWLASQNRQLHNEIAGLPKAAQPVAGEVYSASLISGDLRGGSAQPPVLLPANARMLRLDLELPEREKHETYSAILSGSGRRIWQEEPVRAEMRGQVSLSTVWVPAELLSSGRYTIMLESQGNPVAYYNFTIAR